MKLVLSGRSGARSCSWQGYALLRDNVQHYIENGAPSARFSALHSIERAIDAGLAVIDAARLRGEVLCAWYALYKVPVEDAAVSLRTRAILTHNPGEPTRRGTLPARQVGWRVAARVRNDLPIPKACSHFVSAVLALTETAQDGDLIKVCREGSAPRFVRRGPAAAKVPATVAPAHTAT